MLVGEQSANLQTTPPAPEEKPQPQNPTEKRDFSLKKAPVMVMVMVMVTLPALKAFAWQELPAQVESTQALPSMIKIEPLAAV